MIAAWLIGADAGPPPIPIWDPRLLGATLAFVALTLVGALVIAFLERWRKRYGREDANPHNQLSNFRQLYEEGELSQEEYDRIRNRLNSRMRTEANLPAAPPAQANPGPDDSQAAPPDAPKA